MFSGAFSGGASAWRRRMVSLRLLTNLLRASRRVHHISGRVRHLKPGRVSARAGHLRTVVVYHRDLESALYRDAFAFRMSGAVLSAVPGLWQFPVYYKCDTRHERIFADAFADILSR
jgi:hypothetical protein